MAYIYEYDYLCLPLSLSLSPAIPLPTHTHEFSLLIHSFPAVDLVCYFIVIISNNPFRNGWEIRLDERRSGGLSREGGCLSGSPKHTILFTKAADAKEAGISPGQGASLRI